MEQNPAPFVNITKYQPKGLSPRFPQNSFNLLPIRFPPVPGEMGLARRGSVGNQEDFVDDLCILIPITRYAVLDGNGKVQRKVSTRQRIDCISARVRAPLILVELTWNSDDDFSLHVTEPNGEKLYFRNQRSETDGKYISPGT